MGFVYDKNLDQHIDWERGEILVFEKHPGPWKSGRWTMCHVEDRGGAVHFRCVHKRTYKETGHRTREGLVLQHEIVLIAWWEAVSGDDTEAQGYLSRIGQYLTGDRHMYRMGLARSDWRCAPELEGEWRETLA